MEAVSDFVEDVEVGREGEGVTPRNDEKRGR